MNKLGNKEIRTTLKGRDLYVYFKFDRVPNFSMTVLEGILEIQRAITDNNFVVNGVKISCLLYTSPSPRDS